MSANANSDTVRALNTVDWDFAGSSTYRGSVHSLHWYPTNILPQIPSFLIEILSRPGDVVLDPFCGSGTVGIEALLRSRKAHQSDSCRAAVQVARGKLNCLAESDHGGLLQNVLNTLIWDRILLTEELGECGEGGERKLEAWFSPQTLGQLRYLWKLLESKEFRPLRPALEMVFTDTLFACASTSSARTRTGKARRHHWGWIADNVRPKTLVNHNAIELFRNKLGRAHRALAVSEGLAWRGVLDNPGQYCYIKREDARLLSVDKQSVDLLLTSPPYIGMTDYALANRLTYYWMGWPLEHDFEREIGSRRHRNRVAAEEEYLGEMQRAWEGIVKTLRPGGLCAVVISASRKFPCATQKFIKLLEKLGLNLLWGPQARNASRRRVGNRRTQKSPEYICVWRKE